jgi:fucose permease
VNRRDLSLFLTLAAFALSVNAVPPLIATLSEELSLPAWALGAGITLQFLVFSATSYLSGTASDRLRIPRRAMVLAGLIVMTAALALAPSIISSLPMILVWMSVLGIAGAFVETFASLILAEGPLSGSSKSLCLSQAFYAIGAFCAPQAARASLSMSGSWKSAFVVFGALAAIVAVLFAVFSRGTGGPASGSAARAAPALDVPARPSAAVTAPNAKAFVAFASIILIYVSAESLCGTWMPYMLVAVRGFGIGDAASNASLFWLGMIAGRFFIAFLPDRLTLGPALAASSLLAAAAALCLHAFPSLLRPALCLFGFAMGPIWPVAIRIAAARLESQPLTAAVIAVGGLGAALGPMIGSALLAADRAVLYFPLIAGLACALALIIFVNGARRRASAVSAPSAAGSPSGPGDAARCG